MANKYNYSKHLNNTLSPLLLPLGFKRKGAKFTQQELGLSYFVYLERSSWNSLADRPNSLSAIIGVSIEARHTCTEKLFRITQEKFPNYYAPFFLDTLTWPEKCDLFASFSQKQLTRIDKYLDSRSWLYDSEESLINLLQEISVQIINVGLPALNYTKEQFHKGEDMSSLSAGMKNLAKQLYLEQLNPLSRFPIEE